MHWLQLHRGAAGCAAVLTFGSVPFTAAAAAASQNSTLPPSPAQVLCTLAAVVAYYWPKPWTFPALIILGGLITLIAKRKDTIQVGGSYRAEERVGQKGGWAGSHANICLL